MDKEKIDKMFEMVTQVAKANNLWEESLFYYSVFQQIVNLIILKGKIILTIQGFNTFISLKCDSYPISAGKYLELANFAHHNVWSKILVEVYENTLLEAISG